MEELLIQQNDTHMTIPRLVTENYHTQISQIIVKVSVDVLGEESPFKNIYLTSKHFTYEKKSDALVFRTFDDSLYPLVEFCRRS